MDFGGCTRILPDFPLWPIATTLDLIYCVCSTSWLFYYVFSVARWSSIPIISLFQFPVAGKILKQLRKILLLKTFGLQFIDDRIGSFDISGLEIDTDVDGLMVIRGATIRLSDMSLRAQGVEVGLSVVMGVGEEREEIEVGIACEEVVVRLGRGIEIGDCFASIKGGEGELSFKDAEESISENKASERQGSGVWEADSKMLRAVKGNEFEFEKGNGDGRFQHEHGQADIVDRAQRMMMQEKIICDQIPKDTDLRKGIETIKTITPDNTEAANEQYNKTIQMIQSTNSIQICHQQVHRLIDSGRTTKESGTDNPNTVSENSDKDIRAAICSQLHRQPSITHPPSPLYRSNNPPNPRTSTYPLLPAPTPHAPPPPPKPNRLLPPRKDNLSNRHRLWEIDPGDPRFKILPKRPSHPTPTAYTHDIHILFQNALTEFIRLRVPGFRR